MSTIRRLFFSTLTVTALLWPNVSIAEGTKAPTLLKIEDGAAGIRDLSYVMLTKMPMIEYQTTTIWTDGVQKFEGVPLKALLKDLATNNSNVKATAVNDYAVSIPLSEINDEAPIVAYKMNGKRMTVRDKGPLWLVYPYDRSSEFRSEIIYSRSIWQLTRLRLN